MMDNEMPAGGSYRPGDNIPLSPDIPPNTVKNRGPNVDGAERIGSGMLGTLLVCWGLRRSGLAGAMAVAGGAALLGRSVTGSCTVKRVLQAPPYARAVAQEHGWSSANVSSAAVTIARPRETVYQTWRDFSNLPRFLAHVEHIEVVTPQRSRWTVKAPLQKTEKWTSYVTEDIPNERIAWESEGGATVPNFGWVEFRDAAGRRGTEVRALIAYRPPYGEAGRLLGMFLPETPSHQMRDDLRRFKQFMETGELAVSGTLER